MRLSYRAKLLVFFLGMVLLLETLSYGAIRSVIRDAVIDSARSELQRGGELFSQLMRSRASQLSVSVDVLTDDFGFKQAVATEDAATIRSVLINHSARIDADAAMVLDNQGRLVADSLPDGPRGRPVYVPDADTRLQTRLVGERLYQFVFSPVRAPEQIGIAGIGFEIDQPLTEYFKHLTGLEVSFVGASPDHTFYVTGTQPDSDIVSTPPQQLRHRAEAREVWQSGDLLTYAVHVSSDQTPAIYAVLQVPLSEAMTPFAVLDGQLFTLTMSFFLVAALVALVLARSVVKPVSELAAAARHIAAGRYNARLPAPTGDELGQLARAFNHMQSAIADRESKILFQLKHDPLTELENRTQVFPRMQERLESARQLHRPLLVAVADIDKFTEINDTLSVEVGDEVLREVSRRLQQSVQSESRDDRSVLRLGSDEFLVLCELERDLQAKQLAAQLREHSHSEMRLGDVDVRAELNIGYSVYPQDGETVDLLLRRANLALNAARSAQSPVVRYQSGWDELHMRRIRLLEDFSAALTAGEFQLYYQPKVDLQHPQVLAAEALIRWHHPEFGFVNPEEFISVLESAGRISRLTRWVVEEALAASARFRERGLPLLVSVNFSALDLMDGDLVSFIRERLEYHGLEASSLHAEVTESAIMREAERSLATLHQLRELGVGVAIDDFGTGYSSLSQLKKLPVTELKIDKSFILQLDNSEEDQLIVQSTIELGHTLEMKVTAEGVETETSRNMLQDYGCDLLQGYFYSRPLPEEDFCKWARRHLDGGQHG